MVTGSKLTPKDDADSAHCLVRAGPGSSFAQADGTVVGTPSGRVIAAQVLLSEGDLLHVVVGQLGGAPHYPGTAPLHPITHESGWAQHERQDHACINPCTVVAWESSPAAAALRCAAACAS